MGRTSEKSDGTDSKSQLVINICNISNRATSCAHWDRRRTHPGSTPIIDWYLVLQVEENVGMDVIRRQYRKLALLLHPDKNKHPKAGVAFKLIYEAYLCLSDNTRRAAFDLERGNNICSECRNKVPRSPPVKRSTKLRAFFSLHRFGSTKIMQMDDIKEKFKEEVIVIEKCLKLNAASRKEFSACNSSAKEIPVFNPSDYMSQGYPHYPRRNSAGPESFWCLRKGKYDYPIFGSRPERSLKLEPASAMNDICNECKNKVLHSPPVKRSKRLRDLFSSHRFRSIKILEMNDIKEKLKKRWYMVVIKAALKFNAASQKEFSTHNPSVTEIPVLSHSDYLSQGYPHCLRRKFTGPEFLVLEERKCNYPIFGSKSEISLKLVAD